MIVDDILKLNKEIVDSLYAFELAYNKTFNIYSTKGGHLYTRVYDLAKTKELLKDGFPSLNYQCLSDDVFSKSWYLINIGEYIKNILKNDSVLIVNNINFNKYIIEKINGENQLHIYSLITNSIKHDIALRRCPKTQNELIKRLFESLTYENKVQVILEGNDHI